MAVYNFNLLLILFLFFYSEIKKKIVGNENFEFGKLIIFLSLWLISALRYMVGTDYSAYKYYFDNIEQYDFNNPLYERGYYLINYIVSLLTDNSQYLFLVTSFMIIYLFINTINKFSVSYAFSIFLFVTMYFYYESFNITRQYIVVAISFYSIRYILSNNFKKFIIIIIVASFFHATALLMIPFYWLSKMKISNKIYIIVLILTLTLSNFTENIVGFLAKFIPKLSYYVSYNMEGASANITTAITISILVFSLIYKKKLKLVSKNSDFFINMVYFGLLFIILSRENIMFYRISLYFNVSILLLIPICIKVVNKYIRVVFYEIVLIFMTSYHYYLLLNNNSGILPYKVNVNVIVSTQYIFLLFVIYIINILVKKTFREKNIG